MAEDVFNLCSEPLDPIRTKIASGMLSLALRLGLSSDILMSYLLDDTKAKLANGKCVYYAFFVVFWAVVACFLNAYLFEIDTKKERCICVCVCMCVVYFIVFLLFFFHSFKK